MIVKAKPVTVGELKIGQDLPLILIGGPCVIETEDNLLKTAEAIKQIVEKRGIPWIFKASFDKANRSSVTSYRGPGLEEGLRLLEKIKTTFKVPVLTDIHTSEQALPVAQVADVLQIPAFLCRQTDLLIAAGNTNLPINVKKGQFVAPEDMEFVLNKIRSTGNEQLMLTERGTFFGYHNQVVDMRALPAMRHLGVPVIFDATHSVQRPSAGKGVSGGDRAMVPYLARAAVATGVDGVFMEIHLNPDEALCDGPNMWPVHELDAMLDQLQRIHAVLNN
ncbi:3-deoxy-8-phosphooctulonate synthase [bacterium]|nr:3-deoxy-8-phosphooctulonate synthase [bacterium]